MKRALALAAVLIQCCAWAEAAVTAPVESGAVPARGRVSLTGGLSGRSSHLTGDALTIGYDGVSPVQLKISAAFFVWRSLGLAFDGGGDWYSASGSDLDGQQVNFSVSGYRALLAVAGRLSPWRALSLEAHLGYGFGASPVLDASSGQVLASPVSYHGPAVAIVAVIDPGFIVSGQLFVQAAPFSLHASGPQGAMRLGAYSAGAQLALGRLSLLGLMWSAVVDYELTALLGARTGLNFAQTANRFGLGVKLTVPTHLDPVEIARAEAMPGTLRGTVSLPGGRPAVGARVEVGAALPVVTDAEGHFTVLGVGPGSVEARVTAEGFKLATATAQVPADGEAEVAVSLVKPFGPGSLKGTVKVAQPEGPAVDLEVTVEGQPPVRTDADGRFVIPAAGPGPVSLTVKGKGYEPLDEVVQVPPEAPVEVAFTVHQSAQKPLATLRGQVRSAAGKPVAATVKIPEAKVRVQVGSDGRFEVRVPGGKYTVVIDAPGFLTQTLTVEVADGDHAIFHSDLQKAPPR